MEQFLVKIDPYQWVEKEKPSTATKNKEELIDLQKESFDSKTTTPCLVSSSLSFDRKNHRNDINKELLHKIKEKRISNLFSEATTRKQYREVITRWLDKISKSEKA